MSFITKQNAIDQLVAAGLSSPAPAQVVLHSFGEGLIDQARVDYLIYKINNGWKILGQVPVIVSTIDYVGLQLSSTGALVYSTDYPNFLPQTMELNWLWRYPKAAWDANTGYAEIYFTDESNYPWVALSGDGSVYGTPNQQFSVNTNLGTFYPETDPSVVVDEEDAGYYRCTVKMVRDATKVQFFLNGSATPISFRNIGGTITGKTDFTDADLLGSYSTDGYPYSYAIADLWLLHKAGDLLAPTGLTPDQALVATDTYLNIGGQTLQLQAGATANYREISL